MATDLRSGKAERSVQLVRQICRNGETFVHRVASATAAGTREQFHSKSNHSRRAHFTAQDPELNGTSSATMTSYSGSDTGTFLQQFTNSVSRALHKQTCTCNGKIYTAGELQLKSNPAIFAPNFLEMIKQSKKSFLPPVDGGGIEGKQKPAERLNNYSQPKTKPGYAFEPHQRRTNPAKVKKLGETFPSKRPRSETNLPEKLDVIDKSGQNWQITHESHKQHKKRSGRLKPVASQMIMQSFPPSNSSRLGHNQTTVSQCIKHPQTAPISHSNIDQKHNLELNSSKLAPQTASCKILQFTELPHVNSSSSANRSTMPHLANDRLPLQLDPVVQMREDVSHRAPVLVPVSMKPDNVNPKQTSRTSQKRDLKETVSTPSLPSLNADSTAKLDLSGGYNKTLLPLELQNLYKRGSLKISTLRIDMGGALPENFLYKHKDELRQIYPMYDWRIGRETLELRDRLRTSTNNRTTEVLTAGPSTFQLPAKFAASQDNSPEDKSRLTGKEWKRHKKVVRNEKARASERLDAMKEGIGTNGETAMSVEQVGVNAVDMRPISGLFPRQPPPTPCAMDGRRKMADNQP